MKKIYAKYKDRPDFKMIGISLDKKMGRLKSYIEKEQIGWPQYCDLKKREGELVGLYNGFYLPTKFLIDKNGIIRYNHFSDDGDVSLEALVDELMEEERVGRGR